MEFPKYVQRQVPDLVTFTVVLSDPVLLDVVFLTVVYEETPDALNCRLVVPICKPVLSPTARTGRVGAPAGGSSSAANCPAGEGCRQLYAVRQ